MPIVAGGGLSGLSAAYYLSKKYSKSCLKLLLLEGSDRCGGWVKSDQRADFLFEAGPRTIRPKGIPGANTLNLIEDIGLSDAVLPIPSDHVAARNRMIYANNKLHLLPSNLMGALVTKPPFSKPLAMALLHDLKSKPKLNLDDDSMYNFVSRRFGKELADYAISPMLCGICAGDAKQISVKFLLSHLFDMEQKHGGVVKGLLKNAFNKSKRNANVLGSLAQKAKDEKWNIYSLKGGLEVLPKAIEKSLEANNIPMYTNHKIQEIAFYKNNQKVNIKVKDDYAFCSDHLYSCLPAYKLGELLDKSHPQLSGELKNIPFVNVAVINLQYDAENLLKQSAFGFLVPPMEKLPILGVIYDSCCFPNQKGTVITVMMGGKWFEEYFGDKPSESQMLEVAETQIRNILHIEDRPDNYKVNILEKCIPQYVVGHHDRVKRIRKYIQDKSLPLSLCGSSYDGVGVNDVILSALTAVESTNLT
ncbi:protoporphyrinogen oxidase [Arctopsyche grandis]|uniref:protoporphyrinogen oxidase n=1 Tax=Arctopsyche grandis TaxID=121162 RepID=UPI00406D789C